jgi:hypothetical protein
VIVGYVGKSRQTVKQREEQHRDCQPFSDVIVGGSWTIEEGWWTDDELDERERYYIRNGVVLAAGQAPQRPVYNYDFNLDNPDRIEIWRAIKHRQQREPGWVPPPKGGPVPRPRRGGAVPTWRPARRSWLARWWRVRRWPVLFLSAFWTVALVGFWIAAAGTWQGWDAPRNSAIGATLVLIGSVTAKRRLGRPRRRRRSRRRR